MLAAIMTFVAVSLAQAPAKPAPPPSLTGKWTVTLEMSVGTATPTLTLVQDGEKLTGTYEGRYGKFALKGTLKGKVIEFAFTMNAEGSDTDMGFHGDVATDFQSMKGTASLGGAGDANWTAKRSEK